MRKTSLIGQMQLRKSSDCVRRLDAHPQRTGTLQRGVPLGGPRRRNCRCRDELRLRFLQQLFLFRIKFPVLGGSYVILCSLEFVCLDEHQRDVNGCVGIVQLLRRQTLDNGKSLCISAKAMK